MSSRDSLGAEARGATVRAAIQESGVFGCLNAEAVDELLAASELWQVRAGEIVCRPGDPGDHIAMVVSGALTAEAPGCGDSTPLNRIGPGEIFGEMAVLRGAPRSAQVTAAEPCELLIVCQAVFLSLLVSHPAISIRMLGAVSDRLQRLTEAFRQALTPAPL